MGPKSTELVVTEQQALTVSSALEEQLADIQADGFENVTAEDVALPILRILQSGSPQCDK